MNGFLVTFDGRPIHAYRTEYGAWNRLDTGKKLAKKAHRTFTVDGEWRVYAMVNGEITEIQQKEGGNAELCRMC